MLSRLYSILSFFVTVVSVSLSAQSEYLDHSFGVNGTLEIIVDDSLSSTFVNIFFDEDNRIYYSYGVSYDTITEYGIRKLSQDGNLLSWEISHSNETNNWKSYSLLDNTIVECDQRLDSQNEGYSLDYNLYDLDADRISRIKIPGLSYSNYWLATTNNNFVIDRNKGFVVVLDNGLYRYESDGQLDLTFGENGFVSLNTNLEQDSLSFFNLANYWTYLMYSSDNSFLVSYSNYEAQDSLFYHRLSRFDYRGVMDVSFGDNGFYESDSSGYILRIQDFKKGGYLLSNFNFNFENIDSCWYNYQATVLDKDGKVDLSYGKDGILESDTEDCIDWLWFHEIGPEEEVMSILTDNILDGNDVVGIEYQLRKYNLDGQPELSFAENGELVLDFLREHVVLNVTQDKDHNLYILHRPLYDSIAPYPSYLTKFDGSKIWNRSASISRTGAFTLSPNPTSGEIGLLYEGDAQDQIDILIFDMQGRLITSKEVLELNRRDRISLGDMDLTAGAYFVLVRNANGASLFYDKVIVVR